MARFCDLKDMGATIFSLMRLSVPTHKHERDILRAKEDDINLANHFVATLGL